MRIYHATPDYLAVERYWSKVLNPEPLSILVSFLYIRGAVNKLVELKGGTNPKIASLFLDSGTYTIHNQLKPDPTSKSRFLEYAQYVKLYGRHFDVIATYDEDFSDPELNQYNNERLELILGSNPETSKILPAVHGGDVKQHPHQLTGPEEFAFYKDRGYRYIAIGSFPGLNDDSWQDLQRIRGDAKIHFFGNFKTDVLLNKNPFSIDGSHYAKIASVHAICIWNATTLKLETIELTAVTEDHTQQDRITALREYIGTNFRDITLDSVIADPYDRQLLNMFAIQQMQKTLNEIENSRNG